MREAHVGDVVGELVGELEVGERPVALERVPPPRAEVHLVDRHRPRRAASALARALEPRRRPATRSATRSTIDAVCGGTSVAERERVGLQPQPRRRRRGSRTCSARPARRPGTKSSQMPDAPSERIGCRRPSQPLKSPTTLTDARVRRPDRERGAGDAVELARRARRAARRARSWRPSPARCRSSSPSVGRNEYGSRSVTSSPPGRRPRARSERQLASVDHALEDAGRRRRGSSSTPVGSTRTDSASGPERADDDAAVARVRAEVRVRVGELDGDEPSSRVTRRPARSLEQAQDPGDRDRRPSRAGCRARSAARRPPSRARRREQQLLDRLAARRARASGRRCSR